MSSGRYAGRPPVPVRWEDRVNVVADLDLFCTCRTPRPNPRPFCGIDPGDCLMCDRLIRKERHA